MAGISQPRAPLQVSAKEFDLGRPDTTAPNVAQLADAVRQGYISAGDIQARALQHPTLVAEAAAGPELVQAKLAAARSETAPAMLQAKAELATATAEKARAEADIQQQMAALGETGRGHLAFLRSKGVVVEDLSPEGLAQQYSAYRSWETSHELAKAALERYPKPEVKDHPEGGKEAFHTSNGMVIDESEVEPLKALAKSANDWLFSNSDYRSWKGQTFNYAPGAVAPAAPAASAVTGPRAPRTILPPSGQIIGAPAPVTAPAPKINPENFTPVSQVIPAPAPAPAISASAREGAALPKPVYGGTVFPRPKERIPGEQVEKAGTAETAVDTALRLNSAYLDLVATRRKMLGPIAGRAMKAVLAKEWDEKVAIFQQAATALLAPVAKGIFNETGVLSDKDVARYEGVFPSIQDTPDVGLKKLASITDTILTAYQKKANNWEAFGYTSGPMQATADKARQEVAAIYQQFGMDFNNAAAEGSIFEAFESGNVRTVNGTTYAAVPGPKGSVVYRTVDPAVAKRLGGASPKKLAETPRKPGKEGDPEYVFPTGPGKLTAPTVEPRIFFK